MEQIRIGVLGAYRGTSMINYCEQSSRARVVAICDKNPEALQRQKDQLNDPSVAWYDNFDSFIEHPMDAVVLANYANEHAPFAIRCLEKGLHVFSEVLPCQTMQEAVNLVEAVERSGKVYAYSENYCYMAGPREMRRLYQAGEIGEFEYGEGEYIHNCAPIWPSITYGERDHWRNNMYATFYCTHSAGPIFHITGLRPVSVVGFEGGKNQRRLEGGCKAGQFGMEIITLNNGGIIKSIHGDLYKNSIWYTVYGSKGRMETAREDAKMGDSGRIYVNSDAYAGEYGPERLSTYLPVSDERSAAFGHGGSDYLCMDEFVKRIQGDETADTIDVYQALDMFLPGMFAYRSVLQGGVSVAVPNLRDKAQRDAFRNDTACTDPHVAGDQLLPVFSKGTPEIPESVYDHVKELWEKEKNGGDYVKAAMTQGSSKK